MCYCHYTVVDPKYGENPEDLATLRKALSTARSLLTEEASPGLWYMELLPGPLFGYGRSHWGFDRFYRMFLMTYFHFCGTCSMDTVSAEDVQIHGIVDNTLRVRGIENLRIADASVIPHIPSAPIAATAMALGLAAGQMVNAKITHSMQTSLKSYPVPAATT
jgi:choline dehydrogenase-like flavoprotein